MKLYLFGIRHHGPGSARSLKTGLEVLQPDCLLIEGPPEANALLPFVLEADMVPPVALLLYARDNPAQAMFYPFAEFSPEWQALQFGLRQKIPTRFFDLPIAYRFSLEKQSSGDVPAPENVEFSAAAPQAPDPLQLIAQAAGYDEFEPWWSQLVEEREDSEELFEAILEIMTAVRDNDKAIDDTASQTSPQLEILREAQMRQMIRQAQTEGFKRIAVVCGAYHTPALTQTALDEHSNDNFLLENLSEREVAATWIPWTFRRLSRFSGYGAGITSPGWYQHLWQSYQPGSSASSIRWLSQIAGLLRAEGFDASSAQVIEGVRLADTLAAMRTHARAGLSDLNEAAYALFAHGNELLMKLIEDKLIVGDRLGSVPAETPAAPLQQDLAREIKRLRLTQDASVRELELDLRKEIDLARSQLLQRLHILGIPWGHEGYARSKGSFKEIWQLKWEPEYSLILIEMGHYGQTVASAASGVIAEKVQARASSLQMLADLLERGLLADLPDATGALLLALERQATENNDILHLMAALPPLARIARYGDVRQRDQTRADMLGQVVNSFLVRICIGLPNAAHSINDEAAQTLFGKLLEVDASVKSLQDEEQVKLWLETLQKLSRGQSHGLIQGRSVRLLMEAGILTMPEVSQTLTLAVSNPEPEKTSVWLEGFLRGSGLVLIHDAPLLSVLDHWLASLSNEHFRRILPLLRRTFSSFDAPERRSIGEKVKHIDTAELSKPSENTEFDPARGAKVLPLAAKLLGLRS